MEYDQTRMQLHIYNAIYKETDAVYSGFAKRSGLSDCAFWLLYSIRDSEDTCRQKDLCGQWTMSKQTVNSAFRLLVKKGLVRLKPQEGNLRVKQIVFTDAGERFAMRYIDDMLALEERVWMELPEEERAALTRLTYKFNGMLDAELKKRFE